MEFKFVLRKFLYAFVAPGFGSTVFTPRQTTHNLQLSLGFGFRF